MGREWRGWVPRRFLFPFEEGDFCWFERGGRGGVDVFPAEGGVAEVRRFGMGFGGVAVRSEIWIAVGRGVRS